MDPVVVVGAGIGGVSCARALCAAGLGVHLIDRGRRVGGRMAVYTRDDRPTDIGASYFTVSDPRFAEIVAGWQRRGLAHAWTDTFEVFEDGSRRSQSGPLRWAAARGLGSLVEDLAEGLAVERARVDAVQPGPRVDGLAASAVVLAMPDPQAARLLHPELAAVASVLDNRFEPVIALAAGWSRRSWSEQFQAAFVNNERHLSWIADDGRRRGDGGPVLVAHSTADTAAGHLADPDAVREPMVAALRGLLDIAEPPAWTHLHSWTYAKPVAGRDARYLLDDSLVGVCGDSWSDRPRVEAAYLSGLALAEALVRRLGRQR